MIHFWVMIEINVFGNTTFSLLFSVFSFVRSFFFFLITIIPWFHALFSPLFFYSNLFYKKWLMALRITFILFSRSEHVNTFFLFIHSNILCENSRFIFFPVFSSLVEIISCLYFLNKIFIFSSKMSIYYSFHGMHDDNDMVAFYFNVNRFMIRPK